MEIPINIIAINNQPNVNLEGIAHCVFNDVIHFKFNGRLSIQNFHKQQIEGYHLFGPVVTYNKDPIPLEMARSLGLNHNRKAVVLAFLLSKESNIPCVCCRECSKLPISAEEDWFVFT